MNYEQFEKSYLLGVLNKHIKEESKLRAIKAIIDSYDRKTINITIGNDDADYLNHIYDLSTIIGIIQIHVCDGLNENIPQKKG